MHEFNLPPSHLLAPPQAGHVKNPFFKSGTGLPFWPRPRTKRKIIAIKDLRSYQPYLEEEKLKGMAYKPTRKLATVHEENGKFHIHDGNHRLADLKRKGRKRVAVKVIQNPLEESHLIPPIQFARGDIIADRIRRWRRQEPLENTPLAGTFTKQLPPKGSLKASFWAQYIKRLRKARVKPFSLSVTSPLLSLYIKSSPIQFQQLYQPRRENEPPETLPRFTRGQLVDYTVQEHAARRAGLHRDIRIGTPRHGLLSWATRKNVPEPGQRVAIHPQPVHPHSYLGWSGEIPSGYGAGKVRTQELGKALVTESTPDELHATLASKRGSHRLAFVRSHSGGSSSHLLISGRAPQPPPTLKPPAKQIAAERIKPTLKALEGTRVSVQPKIDGALVFISTKGNRPEVFSHRVSKVSGLHPIHTERVFRGRPTIEIPKEHQRDLVGELYGVRKGRAIEPQALGGLLNTHIGESISRQQKAGIKLKIMPFDLTDRTGPYPERLEKVKQTLRYLPKDTFHAPEEATTSEAAMRLYEKVKAGRHPLTKEGVIIHPEHGKMLKVKNTEETDVKIHSIFPGSGKFSGSHGGFIYSDKHGKPLGRVGTGFTDETRRELHKYVGRTARVRYQERFPSGRLRAPSFIAIHESKN